MRKSGAWPPAWSLATLACALAGPHGAAYAQTGEQGLDPLKLQQARTERLKAKNPAERFYTRQFDLSGLPPYRPATKMSGTLRQWGSNYLADSMLESYLEKGFLKFHPDVKFETSLKSTFLGMPGLYTGLADLAAMGRRATWDELQTYQRVFEAPPVEITMATGSFNIRGWSWALVPFVHEDNPIKNLTLEQLDGIFGAERNGGWTGNGWDPRLARGPEKNIRTWGQLGATGEWADKPIHVYAYNLSYHFPRDFAEKVFQGGYKWNEQLKEYSNRAEKGGNAGEQLVAEVGRDRYGITYTSILFDTPLVKPLPVAASAAGPYVPVTLETVQDHSYPLTREVYYYANRRAGQKLDPLVREYLRFVLSREGQEAVQRDGKYLPLTAEIVNAQLKKLDAVGVTAKPFD